jgi:Fe-S cluster assembly protein SufD
MRPEETYISLYKDYASSVKACCGDLLNKGRDEAFKAFERLGFPHVGQEEYKYCDLKEELAYDYGLNINRFHIPFNPHDVFCCDVPNLSTRLYYVVNDICYKEMNAPKLPDGVLCGSLNELSRSHAEVLSPYYNTLAAASSDGMVAMNGTYVQDGFVLYIPKGVQIEKPIQLIQVFHGEEDMLSNRRILVIVEENASVQLLVCDHTLSTNKCLSNQVAELFVGENASLDYYELEMHEVSTTRISNTFVRQEADSKLLLHGIVLRNGLTRNNFNVCLAGQRADAKLSGVTLVDENHLVDNHIFIDHAVSHCTSRELYKYILDDASKGIFCGRILVRPDAQKTSAYQSNRNLCSSSNARMLSKPQLEIYADDVKCSHGSATGQIDEQALFYLRARGISESEARLLLKFAFTADVIDEIRLAPLKERMRGLIEKRFRGELARCEGCASSSKSV